LQLGLYPFAVGGIVGTLIWFRMIFRLHALRRRVILTNGRFCPHCGFDLSTLGESGTCPDCRREYTPEWLDYLWGHWLDDE